MLPIFQNQDSYLQTQRNESSFSYPLHIHVPTELIYINHGNMTLEYPNESYTVSQGDFLIIFPYTIHGFCSGSGIVDFITVLAKDDIPPFFENTIYNYHPKSSIIKASKLPSDIGVLMNELHSINISSNNKPLSQSILSLILARTIPLLELKPNTDIYKSELSVKAITYVSEHFAEKLSLDSVAKALGVSRYSISRIFSSTVKINFVDYVHFLRISHAQKLLENTNDSILNISTNCGFESVNTFNRVFKKMMDTTHLQFRLTHR